MSDQLRTPRNTRPLGVIVLVVGLLAAGILWFVAGARRDAAIENLARAPIGCDTTLDFAQPGEYLIFVETTGRLDDVRGDCDATGEFAISSERPPVEITLIDPDGEPLEFESRRDDVTYSSAGFVGRSILSVEVAEAADHVLRAESSESGTFAVVVGRDPNRGVTLLRILAIMTALVGLAVGLVLIIKGGRREPVAVGPWTAAQPTSPTWVQHPGQPPYRAPTQPPYVQPGPQGPPVPFGGAPAPGPHQGPASPQSPPPYGSNPTAPQYGPSGWSPDAAAGGGSTPPAWTPTDSAGANAAPPSPGGPWGQQAPPPASPFAPPQGQPSAMPDRAAGAAAAQPATIDLSPASADVDGSEPADTEQADTEQADTNTAVTDTAESDSVDSDDTSWAPQSADEAPPTLSERRWDTARDD